jgi:hypothetical protein
MSKVDITNLLLLFILIVLVFIAARGWRRIG